MNTYLVKLTKQILSYYPDGISKVRLAKLIYLVHKGLIQKSLADSNSIAYIRMPLGPVPDGLKSIHKASGIYMEKMSLGLSYNKQNYKVEPNSKDKSNNDVFILLKQLTNIQTSELVEYTHDEPSWKQYVNGDVYHIGKKDLQRPLPKKNFTTLNNEIDDQKLQALLINGMIDEIVDESTALEYPQKSD